MYTYKYVDFEHIAIHTYSNTSMLDLGMTKESNSSLVGLSPEFSLCQVKRIIESNLLYNIECQKRRR